MKVYFIVHGNANIGMGHIMRSLSLAKAFRERGHRVIFFSKYSPGISEIKKTNFEVHCIPNSDNEKNMTRFFYGTSKEALQDAQYISNCMSESADVIITDSYNVTADFFHVLRGNARYLVYIDDLNSFPYPVDLLINGSASAFDMEYEKTQTAKLLLGLSYNLIRSEFHNLVPRNTKSEVKDILLTTGNSDPSHMMEKFRDILVEETFLRTVNFHVIIGSGFSTGTLKDLATWKKRNVYFYEQPKHMSTIMQKCDLAITAGGSTLYELASCGVPAIVFAYAENQIPQIFSLKKRGLLYYVGSYQKINEENLIKYLWYMMDDYMLRKQLTDKLQVLVDGQGAFRVVNDIEASILNIQ